MDDTANLQLPLMQAAQAQKHVTVNDGLLRLDGLVQLRLKTLSQTAPSLTAVDGDTHFVPVGGVNAWAGHDREVAIRANGGWLYAVPQQGWRGWGLEDNVALTFDGTSWQPGVVAISPFGAATRFSVLEFDHVVSAGASNLTTQTIPSHAMVFGVTGRVVSTITGTLTGWQLGADGSLNRFGSGLGLGLGSYVKGVLGSPLTGYTPMPLELSAEGGDFAGGTVRLAVHYVELTLPAV